MGSVSGVDLCGARFDGFPGEEGAEDFLAQVAAWNTKRDQGEGYQLPAGAWHSQMDRYEQLFEGKTITEIEDWFVRFCSDETGRPLKSDAASEADQAKYAALSPQEQAELAEQASEEEQADADLPAGEYKEVADDDSRAEV